MAIKTVKAATHGLTASTLATASKIDLTFLSVANCPNNLIAFICRVAEQSAKEQLIWPSSIGKGVAAVSVYIVATFGSLFNVSITYRSVGLYRPVGLPYVARNRMVWR